MDTANHAQANNNHNNNNFVNFLEIKMREYLICLLGNVYGSEGAAVRIGHGAMNWFKIGKGRSRRFVLLSCLFNFCAEKRWKNKNLDEAQVRNKIYVGDMNNLSYPNDNTEMIEEK